MVSVVIPVKNRIRELKRAVDSVLKQDAKFLLEIIIVDNGSDDDQIPSSHLKITDKRIKFLSTGKMGNANTARNMGVAYAKGDYIAFLDSDDEWKPNHLSASVTLLQHTKSDFAYGGAEIDNGVKVWEMKSWQKPHNKTMLNFYLEGGNAPTPTLVGKSEAIKSIAWDEDLNRHQDYDFCIRFSEVFRINYKDTITVKVNWKQNEVRGITIDDIKKFIIKHKIENNQFLHNKYFLKLLRDKAWGNDVNAKKYIEEEVWNYPRYSSFVSYYQAFNCNGKAIGLRVKYILKVLGVI